jgi:uncharacterized protein (DUF488 family)
MGMLLTIGHSNHSLEHFLGLLEQHGVEVLADVRSQPYSRYLPHFNARELQRALKEKGISYLWLEQLGGRPKEARYYDADGHADYAAMSQADYFVEGLERLKRGMEQYRVAIMCSEEDPNDCHRRLLIVRALCEGDPAYAKEIAHIRKDGRLEREEEMREQEQPKSRQAALWDAPQPEQRWRSPKPIR